MYDFSIWKNFFDVTFIMFVSYEDNEGTRKFYIRPHYDFISFKLLNYPLQKMKQIDNYFV